MNGNCKSFFGAEETLISMNKRILLVMNIFLIIIFIPTSNLKFVNKIVMDTKINECISDNPIIIDGNEDLRLRAYQEKWSGNGTQEEPYIIEGYSITNVNVSIIVKNTNIPFTVSNCTFSNNYWGILFQNVSNANVINNTIHDLRAEYFGVYIEHSNSNIIMNNIIFNLNWVGIEIINSENNKIVNNEVYNCFYRGIRICNSNNLSIQANRIYDCNVHGISFETEENSGFFVPKLKGSIIKDNIISQNSHSGLEISMASNFTIEGNIIFENNNGIVIYGEYHIISENTIYNNRENGILQRYTQKLNISKNNFIGNNFEIIDNYWSLSQIYLIEDIGSIFDYNYWSDLNNCNIYSIDGEGFDYSEGEFFPVKNIAKDNHPLSNPNNLELHILSVPRILSPNNHTIYKGELEISWTPSIDYMGHEVNYSVYIWENHEWRLISQNVLSNTVKWDTSKSDDGEDFRIKVVAMCSIGLTSEDISDNSFEIQNKMRIGWNIPSGGYIISFLAFIVLLGSHLTRKRRS